MSWRNSAATVALAASLIAPSLLAQPSVASLQHDIDAIIGAPAFERGFWGILVKPVARDEPLYAVNARKLMMPASAHAAPS